MYDAIDLSNQINQLVSREDEKKYYRFRPTRFYGGISTADAVGCNLRCAFCWSAKSVWNAKNTGSFYSSTDVAQKLQHIADAKGYSQLRISGGEPTIGKKHLLNVLKKIDPSFLFILETNGLLLGYDPTYIFDLARFLNLHVRVCLKGCNRKEFSVLTGAKSTGFDYQLDSLKTLKQAQVSFNIAVASPKKDKQGLYQRLQHMGLGNIMVEEEQIRLYPQVRKRLEKQGLLSLFK
ncbi:MAG: radical SAM protein [Candidatus Thermoplasmatota archaeon]|nr:radical SAM protein [Candidatus Thermoplasmatota archaeon]